MFFFKKKEVILDCFTYSDVAYDHAPIKFAKDHLPEWWLGEVSKTEDDWPSIKFCNGLKDYFQDGIVIPAWFSWDLRVHPNGKWDWTASNEYVDTSRSHGNLQFHSFCGDDAANVKIKSVWNFKTDKLVKFLWTEPTWYWRELEDLSLLPGTIDFKRQFHTNINFFVRSPKEGEKRYKIPAFTPLVILHPLTEDRITIKNHLVDEKEWNRFNNYDKLFTANNFKERLAFSIERRKYFESSKCPFHFGKEK